MPDGEMGIEEILDSLAPLATPLKFQQNFNSLRNAIECEDPPSAVNAVGCILEACLKQVWTVRKVKEEDPTRKQLGELLDGCKEEIPGDICSSIEIIRQLRNKAASHHGPQVYPGDAIGACRRLDRFRAWFEEQDYLPRQDANRRADDAGGRQVTYRWVQATAGETPLRLVLGLEGPVPVDAAEGPDAAPSPIGDGGDIVMSPDGRAVAWLLDSTLGCAWINEGGDRPRVTPWEETYPLTDLPPSRLLAVRLRGPLAVEAIISTGEATKAVALERGGSWHHRQLADSPSTAACFLRCHPFTVDAKGIVREEPLRSACTDLAPMQSLDAADDGCTMAVVAVGGKEGESLLAWYHLGEEPRVTSAELTADGVVLERRLRPERARWNALVCAGTSVARHPTP